MKIVNRIFVEKLEKRETASPRHRLNRMVEKVDKNNSLFVAKKEFEKWGYKAPIYNLLDKKIQRTVNIRQYKRGWIISKRG